LLGGLDTLESLLKITFAGAPAGETGLHVREQLFVVGDVLVRQRDQPQKAHDIDVRFRRIECDQFGALEDAECRGIHPRRLSPDLVDRCEHNEQDLAHNHRHLFAVEPSAIARRRPTTRLREFLGTDA